ncbi:MAG: hypothetical protein Q9218_004501 [Villophora microphyllina]
MRAGSQSSPGNKEIDETRLWPDTYSHSDATPTIEPPGDVTRNALTVPTVQYALVELMSLYKRLDFGSFTEHNGAFAVLCIEFPFLFDKAKRYSDLLHRQLEQRPGTMTDTEFEAINKLLERYVSTVYSSVWAIRKLIRLEPILVVATKIDETLSVLPSCVASISQLNSEAAMAVNSGGDYLFKTPSQTNQRKPQFKALVDMTRSRILGPWEDLDWLWVNSRHLILGDFPEPRPRIASETYLQRLISLWSSNKAEKMKLSPRQYGILKQGGQLEDIMAEFRPYPKNLKSNAVDEYRRRRSMVRLLAQMMLSTQDAELGVSFPCVKFRCLSEIENPDNPGFVLVYSSRGISSLGEEIQKSHEGRKTPPSKRARQLMALNLAKAILALHLSHQVHGRINPENIFFDLSNADDSASEQEALTTPLLAGFEISRYVDGQSDYLDEEDFSQRVYLHPDRHPMGSQKLHQRRPHDIFSLGLVLIEIGLWTRFRYMQKYQDSSTDQERQAFAARLRKAFSREQIRRKEDMGRTYHAIVHYCLAGEEDRPELAPEDLPEPDTILLGEPNGMQLVAFLEQQLREDSGESGV